MARIYKKVSPPEKPTPKGGAVFSALAAVCAAVGILFLDAQFALAMFCFGVAVVLLIIGASCGSF